MPAAQRSPGGQHSYACHTCLGPAAAASSPSCPVVGCDQAVVLHPVCQHAQRCRRICLIAAAGRCGRAYKLSGHNICSLPQVHYTAQQRKCRELYLEPTHKTCGHARSVSPGKDGDTLQVPTTCMAGQSGASHSRSPSQLAQAQRHLSCCQLPARLTRVSLASAGLLRRSEGLTKESASPASTVLEGLCSRLMCPGEWPKLMM